MYPFLPLGQGGFKGPNVGVQLASKLAPSLPSPSRNSIKALPWYTSVRVKLEDPAYAPWFLDFSPTIIKNHSLSHSPVCDKVTGKCSNLYHDQTQVSCFNLAYMRTMCGYNIT